MAENFETVRMAGHEARLFEFLEVYAYQFDPKYSQSAAYPDPAESFHQAFKVLVLDISAVCNSSNTTTVICFIKFNFYSDISAIR